MFGWRRGTVTSSGETGMRFVQILNLTGVMVLKPPTAAEYLRASA